MRPNLSSRALCFLLLVASSAACKSFPDTHEAPHPQRSTLSADTHTTAADTYEVEAGVVWDPKDVFQTPALIKKGLDTHTEVFLGWTPLQHVNEGPVSETGIGDVLIGMKRMFHEHEFDDGLLSFAAQPVIKLPTADDGKGLGSGEFDASCAVMATYDKSTTSHTAFYQLDLLGDPSDSGFNVGHQLALAGSLSFNEEVSVFGEISGVFVPEDSVDLITLLFGGAFNASADTVLDGGIALGLSDETPDFQFLIGITKNLGVLRSRHKSPALNASR